MVCHKPKLLNFIPPVVDLPNLISSIKLRLIPSYMQKLKKLFIITGQFNPVQLYKLQDFILCLKLSI